MEIYHRRGLWLSPVFAIPAIVVLSIQLDVIEYNNKAPNIAGYIIIGVCSFLTILTAFASTRLYFDNDEAACIQVRKNFYGQKKMLYPYANILNIVVSLKLGKDEAFAAYRVGFTQQATLFGQTETKFIELRYFGEEDDDYLKAINFAKEICSYSDIGYLDDSKVETPF